MVAVVTIGVDELRQIITEACTEAVVQASRKVAADIDNVSAAKAARIVNRRRETVLAALESGALPSTRSGTRWKIRVGDLDAWAKAGCPTSRGRAA